MEIKRVTALMQQFDEDLGESGAIELTTYVHTVNLLLQMPDELPTPDLSLRGGGQLIKLSWYSKEGGTTALTTKETFEYEIDKVGQLSAYYSTSVHPSRIEPLGGIDEAFPPEHIEIIRWVSDECEPAWANAYRIHSVVP